MFRTFANRPNGLQLYAAIAFIIGFVFLQPLQAKAQTVAWWRFEEGSPDTNANGTIIDSSNNKLNGTAFLAPTYRSVSLPNSTLGLQFTGGNQRVFVPDDPAFALTKSLTLEAFIRYDGVAVNTVDFCQIIFRGDDRGGQDPYALAIDRWGYLTFYINDGTGLTSVTSPSPVPLGKFMHIAGTLDDATGKMQLFIDGIPVSTLTTTARPFGPLDSTLRPGIGIGNLQSSILAQPFVGIIDEVRISNVALPPSQFLWNAVSAPTLTKMSPNRAIIGSPNTTITLTGTQFVANRSQVMFGTTALTTQYGSATSLTAVIPSTLLQKAGNFAVTIVNSAPGGGTSTPLTFSATNPVPTLTSISPTTIVAASPQTTITVNGDKFVPGSVVKFGANNLTTTFISATKLTAIVPVTMLAFAGTYTVTVVNPSPGGGTSTGVTFTVANPVPTLSTISPNSVLLNSPNISITLTGTNFVKSSAVSFSGTPLATTYVSPQELKATVSATLLSKVGTYTVSVTNATPGGGTTVPQNFTVRSTAPTITSLSPNLITVGSKDTTVILTGTNFISGCQVIETVTSTVLASTYVSATSVQAVVPANLLAKGTVYKIKVVNPSSGGIASNLITLTVSNPIPTLSTIDPTTALELSSDTHITLTGTNFNSSSLVKIGAVALSTTFVSSTKVTAIIPGSQLVTLGKTNVTVTNPAPGGGTSSGIGFTVTMGSTTIVLVSSPAPNVEKTASEILVTVFIKNTGKYDARNVAISSVKLNGVTSTDIGLSAFTLRRGRTVSMQLGFPTNAATSGTTPTVEINFDSLNAGKGTLKATCALVP